MAVFARWFGRASAPVRDGATPPLDPVAWPRAQDLIALQRSAATLGLQQAGPARAQLAGAHLSRFRGRGMDYQESRAYQSGDDVRSMDWRVTARTTTPHVKLYQEERERPVILFVHLHAGMFFGTRGLLKSALAARAAALLAWAAMQRGDRVGAMIANGAHCELPPRGGKQGVLALVRQLVAHTDPRRGLELRTHADELNAALGRLCRVSLPGSQVLLIGDFQGIDDESGRLLHRLRRHSDVVAFQAIDPIELEPPPPARYGVAVGEELGVLDLRSNAARRAFEQHFAARHRAVADIMRRHAIAHARLRTDEDVVAALRGVLPSRAGRPDAGRLAA